MTQLWTDYPIAKLGDVEGQEAPIRKARLLRYDGDKYVRCEVGGVIAVFKSGYLYMEKGRCGKVPPVTRRILHAHGVGMEEWLNSEGTS